MKLVVIGGPADGKEFEIEEGNNLIGRWDPQDVAYPEIDLEQIDVEAKVSRKHCIIDRRGNSATVEDAGSLNGTLLNKTIELKPGDVRTLSPGDELLIGKIILRFEK